MHWLTQLDLHCSAHTLTLIPVAGTTDPHPSNSWSYSAGWHVVSISWVSPFTGTQVRRSTNLWSMVPVLLLAPRPPSLQFLKAQTNEPLDPRYHSSCCLLHPLTSVSPVAGAANTWALSHPGRSQKIILWEDKTHCADQAWLKGRQAYLPPILYVWPAFFIPLSLYFPTLLPLQIIWTHPFLHLWYPP